MTALQKYVRLESGGLWRAGADEQRRDVSVSFGDATLVISDQAGRPLAHWSLPAVTRQNPNEQPAIYSPDGDTSEVLEITEDTMIDAIEQVREALVRDRPHPGKLRHLVTAGLILGGLALAVFWLPNALTRQTLAVVPAPKRAEIGAAILGHMQVETGPACREPRGVAAAQRLAQRLFGAETMTQIIIVPMLAQGAAAIPGGLILIDHSLLQGTDDPAVAAGYVLASHAGRTAIDPLENVLRRAGLGTTFHLLTTGDIEPSVLQATAQQIVASPWDDSVPDRLGPVFAASLVPSGPYAAVIGVDLPPDPLEGQTTPPILSDDDWISLQNICAA